MPPRRMLTKAVAQKLREDMQQAIDAGAFALNEGQTIDDVIDYIRTGIRNHDYEPGITFEEFYESLLQGSASSGDDAVVQGDKVDIGDLVSYLELYKTAKAKIAEVTEVQNVAKDKITERLAQVDDSDLYKVVTATVDSRPVATWTWVESSRFDTTKFKADHPDLYEQYVVPTSHRRFDVK